MVLRCLELVADSKKLKYSLLGAVPLYYFW